MTLMKGLQGEAADDDGEDEAGPAKKESKLASFTWASKLSDATSSGASALQPGLLQSLTGTIAGTLSGMFGDAGMHARLKLSVTPSTVCSRSLQRLGCEAPSHYIAESTG